MLEGRSPSNTPYKYIQRLRFSLTLLYPLFLHRRGAKLFLNSQTWLPIPQKQGGQVAK